MGLPSMADTISHLSVPASQHFFELSYFFKVVIQFSFKVKYVKQQSCVFYALHGAEGDIDGCTDA